MKQNEGGMKELKEASSVVIVPLHQNHVDRLSTAFILVGTNGMVP